MRRHSLQVIFLFAFSLLFMSCGDSSVKYVDESHEYVPLSLKDRNFSVYVNSFSKLYNLADSATLNLNIVVDSVVLQKLDSSLTPVLNEPNLVCVPDDSLMCYFETNEYKAPYVKLNAFVKVYVNYREALPGYKQDFGTVVWDKKSRIFEVPLMFFVDVGQVTLYDLTFDNTLYMQRMLRLIQEDKFPFTAAKNFARSELGKNIDGKYEDVYFYLISIFGDEYFYDKVDSIAKSVQSPELWKQSKLWATVADSMMDMFGFNCKKRDLCMNVYGLGSCDTNYYIGVVDNIWSKYNGLPVVCNNNVWRIYDAAVDSLGVCSSYSKGDTLVYHQSARFICDGESWIADNFKKWIGTVFGDCGQGNERVERLLDNYFYCDGSEWRKASIVDYDVGVCGADFAFDNVVEYRDSLFYCGKSESRSGRSLEWRLASSDEAYLFRNYGRCSLESDFLQFANVDGSLWGCTFDRSLDDDLYMWRKLVYYRPMETRYVEKTESGSRPIYGYQGDFYFYLFSSTDSTDWSKLVGLYSLIEKKFFSVNKTKDKAWLNSPVNARYVSNRCPNYFRMAKAADIEQLKKEVLAGAIPDLQFNEESLLFGVDDVAENGFSVCVTVPPGEGILNSTIATCDKAYYYIACVKDL